MRRRKMRRQKQIIIISSLCLLLCLCVGYAAFNTQISLKAKGNIKEKGVNITDNVVTEGDGLYEDTYEEGRYIYRGENPNNYIMFNDELWRIIAKEVDGTYKIIRSESLTSRVYDEENHRSTENNSYCTNPEHGCGVYAAVDGIFSTPSGLQSGTVTEDSSIKIYLNDDYYVNNINETAKGQIISHSFNIGAVERLTNSDEDSIEKNIAGEKMYTWTGNVGLINVSDVLKASLNTLCTSATVAFSSIDECNNNYLLTKGNESQLIYWTMNAAASVSADGLGYGYPYRTWYVAITNSLAHVSFDASSCTASYDPRPVVFLKYDITLHGEGTKENPYTIK